MNYTWPGRLHLIVNGCEVKLYFTLWLFGRRWHAVIPARAGIPRLSGTTTLGPNAPQGAN
jgi:hypothetical protein